MRQNTEGTLPISWAQAGFVFHQVAERIPNRPRPADQFADPILPAQPLETDGVIFRERRIVPANRPANLVEVGVDSAGGVMGGGNASGRPIGKPAKLSQFIRHGPYAGP